MGDMTRLLLLLLWVGVAVSTPVDVQKRIIGGTVCGNNERQYHVKLIGNNGTHDFLCGGSLISKSWILTAAHCEQKNITAYLGVHPNPPGTPVVIEAPRMIYRENSNKHDIMLLKLTNSTKIDPKTKDINPVNLPNCTNSPAIKTLVQTAGHAATTLGLNNARVPGQSATLQCVDLEIQTDSFQPCWVTSAYGIEYGNTHFKLFQSPNKDISPGDSGGGVVYNGTIYGVNAFTFDKDHGCVAAAGFVDVCKYQTWIEDTTGVTFPK